MRSNAETIKNTPLKNARELAAMLKELPRDERLRVEGIIIGIGMRRAERSQESV